MAGIRSSRWDSHRYAMAKEHRRGKCGPGSADLTNEIRPATEPRRGFHGGRVQRIPRADQVGTLEADKLAGIQTLQLRPSLLIGGDLSGPISHWRWVLGHLLFSCTALCSGKATRTRCSAPFSRPSQTPAKARRVGCPTLRR